MVSWLRAMNFDLKTNKRQSCFMVILPSKLWAHLLVWECAIILISFRPASAAKPRVTWNSSSHCTRRIQSKEEGCLLPNYIHCNRVFQWVNILTSSGHILCVSLVWLFFVVIVVLCKLTFSFSLSYRFFVSICYCNIYKCETCSRCSGSDHTGLRWPKQRLESPLQNFDHTGGILVLCLQQSFACFMESTDWRSVSDINFIHFSLHTCKHAVTNSSHSRISQCNCLWLDKRWLCLPCVTEVQAVRETTGRLHGRRAWRCRRFRELGVE